MRDIDLLLPGDQFLPAFEALQAAGYEQTRQGVLSVEGVFAIDKTGVTVGSSTSLPDTAVGSQQTVSPTALAFGNAYARLNADDRIDWYVVESENFETIHNHSAYALIERDKTRGG